MLFYTQARRTLLKIKGKKSDALFRISFIDKPTSEKKQHHHNTNRDQEKLAILKDDLDTTHVINLEQHLQQAIGYTCLFRLEIA